MTSFSDDNDISTKKPIFSKEDANSLSVMRSLEARLAYDAAIPVISAEAALIEVDFHPDSHTPSSPYHYDATLDREAVDELFAGYIPPHLQTSTDTLPFPIPIDIHATTPPETPTSVAFINGNLPDFSLAVQEVPFKAQTVILDPNKDGLEQIATFLRSHKNLETVHIFASGTPGNLELGNTILNQDTLNEHAVTIEEWQDCLSNKPPIMIWGCPIAQGEEGGQFLQKFGELTGTPIIGSETLAGLIKK